MLFEKPARLIHRLLIVEDEPLVAFDNEHLLVEAGYLVAATVDGVADALRVIASEPLDLVLVDVELSDHGNGVEVAAAAHEQGVAVLFVSGHCPLDARGLAAGCLSKPYRPRDLLAAIEAIEARMRGEKTKRLPKGLELY